MRVKMGESFKKMQKTHPICATLDHPLYGFATKRVEKGKVKKLCKNKK